MSRRDAGATGAVRGVAAFACAVAGVLAGAPAAEAVDGQVSPGGAHLAFSTGDPLLGADTDARIDLYQRPGGAPALASQGPAGFNGPFDVDPEFHVFDSGATLFTTAEPLVAADADTAVDVYERRDGVTTLVSQGGSFNGPNGAALHGATLDGKNVVLTTRDQLNGRDTDASIDVYRREGDTTTWLSRGASSANGPFDATASVFDLGGLWRAAFLTAEPVLGQDTDSSVDLYVRLQRTTFLVSQGPNGFNGPFDVSPAVSGSADASRLVFRTAEPLVADDTDTSPDLYARTDTGTTLVSRGPAGFNGAFAVSPGVTSRAGDRIVFTTAEGLVAEDTDAEADVYVREGETTEFVSLGPKGFNGGLAATLDLVDPGAARIVFTTAEPLVAADGDAAVDVYARDLRGAGETELVSQGPAGSDTGLVATPEAISSDGSRIVFTTAEPLVASDTDASVDVYAREGGATHQISAGEVNGNGSADAEFEAVGPREVLFATEEPLVAGDTDAGADLYAGDGARTRLVSTPKPDPPAPALDLAPNGPANDNRPILRGSAEPGSVVEVFPGPDCAAGPVLTVTPEELDAGVPLAVADDTTTTFGVAAADVNNNRSACLAVVYVEDSSAAAPTLAGSAPGSPANNESPALFGTAEPGSTVRLYGGGSCAGPVLGSGSAEDFGAGGVAVTVASDSATEIRAAITDRADNVSACSESAVTFREDSTPPRTSRRGPGRRIGDRTPTVRLRSSESESTFRCRIDRGPRFACGPRLTTRRLDPGRHRIRAKAIDAAGNVDATPAVAAFRVLPRR